MSRALFVPLKRQPFEAFADRSKRWEIRRLEGQWAKAATGMEARLRLGYSGDGELRRVVGRVVTAPDADALMSAVPWREALPYAETRESATSMARLMLQGKPEYRAAQLVAIEMLEP